MVFRKMRVDPGYWSDLISQITQQYKVSRNLAEALIMGRFRNGTPLKICRVKKIDYTTNPKFCPFRAHVRAANPRNASANTEPIIRRSMSYSNGSESGLLFISYQKSLVQQFKPILLRMTKHEDFLLYGDQGISNPKKVSFTNYAKVPSQDGKVKINERKMPILRGGEYLFCPPISFFSKL